MQCITDSSFQQQKSPYIAIIQPGQKTIDNHFDEPLMWINEKIQTADFLPDTKKKILTTLITNFPLFNDYKKIDVNQVTIGNGSDELIDLLIRSFCEPKRDNILICEPTFGMFKIYAQLNNVEVLNAPLTKETFLFDEDLIQNKIQNIENLKYKELINIFKNQ